MAERKVPFFVYPDVYRDDAEEIQKIVDDVGNRGAFILQKDLEQFEKNLSDYLGIKHVLGVGNATDGLYMLCRASGLGPGDEVLFCTHTMVATAAGISFSGATPVPVETGWDHEMDPSSVEQAITSKTKAIMPTQLNGRCADMDALQKIADKHGLFILEDSAQALGAKYKGKCAGSFGRGGVISFYPAKTLGCLGDGGCIITNDDEVYEQCKLFRDHGRIDTLEVVCWCLNSRLDNLQAAILDYKLTKYDQAISRRREIAGKYQEGLGGLDAVRLPPGPEQDADRFDIFQNYEIEAERRDELKSYLAENGIGTMIQWGGLPVHAMKKLGFTRSLPFTEQLFEKLLMLPMNTSLTDDDVEYVCATIRQFYQ
ncbi:DegT/DnrJ/EryC1/StrS family aminotransferase [Desulfovermiculus halophilus]|uniref:DegT/DnrJ/EryC1/StrS family aminotransferase n=1 Tax=Desulfovermiculus halophilus TaxID=339722 RepID=UPI00054EDC8C|nr:DegT/DnrJ/EryC1/StrS family aminotransferase [Desulfovermiculus halophilus]